MDCIAGRKGGGLLLDLYSRAVLLRQKSAPAMMVAGAGLSFYFIHVSVLRPLSSVYTLFALSSTFAK